MDDHKGEIQGLKEEIQRLNEKCKNSEVKRVALGAKITKLKRELRIQSDKLLNTERKRLLAEYNLFLSDKKIKKLESKFQECDWKDTTMKRERTVEKRSSRSNGLSGEARDRVARSERKDIPGAVLEGTLRAELDGLSRGRLERKPGPELQSNQPPHEPTVQSLDLTLGSLSLEQLHLLWGLLRQGMYVRRRKSNEALTKADLDMMSSKVHMMKTMSKEFGKEINLKQSFMEEKKLMVANVRNEISKIREIIKLRKTIGFDKEPAMLNENKMKEG